jgi:nitrate/nitrite transport system substrate-binding protein
VAVPADAMHSSTLMDGTVWEGKDPMGYAARFEAYA